MRRDYPLWALVVGVAATCPALVLGWCVSVLVVGEREPQALGQSGHYVALAAAILLAVGSVSVCRAAWMLVRGLRQTRRLETWVSERQVAVPDDLALLADRLGIGRFGLVEAHESVAVTVGAGRPAVWISTGLVKTLTGDQLRAVLTHECATCAGATRCESWPVR